jgi:hypothetical protein
MPARGRSANLERRALARVSAPVGGSLRWQGAIRMIGRSGSGDEGATTITMWLWAEDEADAAGILLITRLEVRRTKTALNRSYG